MYFEWNAKPELLTSFAKIPSVLQFFTKSLTLFGGPEIVTLSSLLWQAAIISAGNLALVFSQDKPKRFDTKCKYIIILLNSVGLFNQKITYRLQP